MLAAAEAFYAELEASGTPVRYTHRQAGDVQWRYNQTLAEACGPGEQHPPAAALLLDVCNHLRPGPFTGPCKVYIGGGNLSLRPGRCCLPPAQTCQRGRSGVL